MTRIAEESITPLIITYNEEANLARALDSLAWARRVMVLDSGSTDNTKEIALRYSNVEWHTRAFDRFKEQTEYGIYETGIATEFVLALDADMAVSSDFIAECEAKFLPARYSAGLFSFDYRVQGKSLAGSIYGTHLRLFKRDEVSVLQIGHGHKFAVKGAIYDFKSKLIHDDRKPLERWIASQITYSRVEFDKIKRPDAQLWRDKLRRSALMPIVAGLIAYVRAGGVFRGAAAAHYAYERATYESLLALRLLSARLENEARKSE